MRRLNLNKMGFACWGRALIVDRPKHGNLSKHIIKLPKREPWKDPVQASPELLEQIKDKVTLSRKRTHKKRLLVWGITISVLLIAFFYFEIHLKI